MARTNIRVTALIFRADKILLVRRIRDGREYWVVPGGSVEEGESTDEALRRELSEETDLQLISYQHAFDFEYKSPFGERICKSYVCDTLGEPKLGDGPEKRESSPANQYILTWVSVQDLGELASLYPDTAKEIQKVFNTTPNS